MYQLSQTHSQALQMQTQTLQTLQEQQAQLLAAILPLLPLLQAVPLHIDSACNNIKEALLASTHTHAPRNPSIPDPATGPSRKRSHSTLNSDGLIPESMPPKKRTRLNNNSDALSRNASLSIQFPDQDSQLSKHNSYLAPRGYQINQTTVQQIPRAYSNIQRPSLLCSSPITHRNRSSLAPDPNIHTSRRPLKDILLSVQHPDYPHPRHSPSRMQCSPSRARAHAQKPFNTPFITSSIKTESSSTTTLMSSRTTIDLSRSSLPPANSLSKSAALPQSHDSSASVKIDTNTQNSGHILTSTIPSTVKPMSLRDRTVPLVIFFFLVGFRA